MEPTNSKAELIVIDSSDDENDRDGFAAESESSIVLCTEQDALALFSSILPHISRDQAVESLIAADWNVERAVDSALCLKEHPLERVPRQADAFILPQTKQANERTEEWMEPTAAKDTSKALPVVTSKRSLSFGDDAEQKKPRSRSVQPLSEQWRACIEQTRHAGEDHFIDSDFPPAPQSLDGRLRLDSAGSPVKCLCGLPAAARQVRADGPNYARFYLSCGQVQRRRARVVVVKRDDTATREGQEVGDAENAESSSSDDNDEKKQDAPATIRNPYAKKQKTVSTPTKIGGSSSTTTAASPSTPQRKKCNFFQWDTSGSLGAASASGGGYGSAGRNLSWCHFGLEQRCTLYKKSIDTSQIRQGAVGDCWFLSALVVVAEKPYLIQKVVPHDALNETGCYQINLFLDGQWLPVIVDSYLPVVLEPVGGKGKKTPPLAATRLRGGIPVQLKKAPSSSPSDGGFAKSTTLSYMALPAFCAAPDRQLWPPIVEKAYAKAHGSYHHLSGGFIAEGLQDLTGAPTETIIFQAGLFDPDTFWTKLLSFHTAGFLMGVATARGGDGLVGGHAYSVLDVLQVPDVIIGEQSKVTDYFCCNKRPEVVVVVERPQPDSSTADCRPQQEEEKEEEDAGSQVTKSRSARTTVRLVRIRNPWGKREWKGDWSADSERWTRALRKRLGSDTFAKGDGTFYMSFEDMLHRFHHMDVAKTREGWAHSSADGSFVGGSDPMASSQLVYRLTVEKTTQAFVTVIQPKKRSNTKSQYWYCDPSMLLLQRMESGEWQCVACVLSGVKRQNHADVFLEADCTYYCIPFSCLACQQQQRGGGTFPFRLTIYSGENVSVAPLSADNDRSIAARRAGVGLLHKELLARDLKLVYPVATAAILACVHGEGSLYFVAVNGAADRHLSLRITVDLPDGLLAVFGRPEDSYDVPPASQRLLLVVATNGKVSTATEFCFRYLSSTVNSVTATIDDAPRRPPTRQLSFGSSIELSLVGDLLTGSIDSSSSSIQISGGGTIDTYLWIPQLGAF